MDGRTVSTRFLSKLCYYYRYKRNNSTPFLGLSILICKIRVSDYISCSQTLWYHRTFSFPKLENEKMKATLFEMWKLEFHLLRFLYFLLSRKGDTDTWNHFSECKNLVQNPRRTTILNSTSYFHLGERFITLLKSPQLHLSFNAVSLDI